MWLVDQGKTTAQSPNWPSGDKTHPRKFVNGFKRTFFLKLQPSDFTEEDAELLFGPGAGYKAAFEELDTDEDGEVRHAFSFICPVESQQRS